MTDPDTVVPAPLADRALRDELVWIAIRRRGIDRHQVNRGTALTLTTCWRSTRTGELLAADDPWIVANTTHCRRCWPGGA